MSEQEKVTPVSTSVAMPNPNARKGRRPAYPFEDLIAPGMSFGVVGKSKKDLSYMVNNQNRKYRREIKSGQHAGKIKQDRHFFAKDVDPASDPDGATVRVFRDV